MTVNELMVELGKQDRSKEVVAGVGQNTITKVELKEDKVHLGLRNPMSIPMEQPQAQAQAQPQAAPVPVRQQPPPRKR